MNDKEQILKNICYTDLVYGRFNKKLHKNLTRNEIEQLVKDTIGEVDADSIQKIGKNFYISNEHRGIRLTVNKHNYRLITADLLKENGGASRGSMFLTEREIL
ncbi:MAG: DUF3781 domain-containing protein [Spirochaetales bacterium]|nr:DUF3781 domain-containing protein [Spirochaetales bacterium]